MNLGRILVTQKVKGQEPQTKRQTRDLGLVAIKIFLLTSSYL